MDEGLKQKALQALKQIFPHYDEKLLMKAILNARNFSLAPPDLLSNDFSSFLQLCINEFIITDGEFGGEYHTEKDLPVISTPHRAKQAAAGEESSQRPFGISSQWKSNPSTSFSTGNNDISLPVNQKVSTGMDSSGSSECAILIPSDSTTSIGFGGLAQVEQGIARPAAVAAKCGSVKQSNLHVEPQSGTTALLQTSTNSTSSSQELSTGEAPGGVLSQGKEQNDSSAEQATASEVTSLGQCVSNSGKETDLVDKPEVDTSQISNEDLSSVMDLLPTADPSEVKIKLSEMKAMYPVSYLDATVDFFYEQVERMKVSSQKAITPLDSLVCGDRSTSKERAGFPSASGTEQKTEDTELLQCKNCAGRSYKCVDGCFNEVVNFPGVNVAANKEKDDVDDFLDALLPGLTSLTRTKHFHGSSHAVDLMTSKVSRTASGPVLPAVSSNGIGLGVIISSSTGGAMGSAQSGRRGHTACSSPVSSFLLDMPYSADKGGTQQALAPTKSAVESAAAPKEAGSSVALVDRSLLTPPHLARGAGDLPSAERKAKSGKRRSDSSRLTYQDYLNAKSSVDRGEFQMSRAEEQQLLAEAAARHREKRYIRKRKSGAGEQRDAVEVSPSKQRKREDEGEMDAHVNSAAAASGTPDVNGEEEEREKEVHSPQESGGTSAPTLTEEEIMEISDDADLDLMLGCDDCKSVRSPAELAQCNNGHLLCQPCVDKIAKIILTSSEKLLELECPIDNCSYFVPFGEAKRVLYPLVTELLENKFQNATRENIKSMDNVVVCPGCGDMVELDADVQEFSCRNLDCMVSCCRYCKKDWNGIDHSDCSALLSSLDNISENIGTLPPHWNPTPPNFSENYVKVEVEEDSKEWKEVSQLFLKTVQHSAVLKAIYRIQNPRLWQKFVLMRQHMVADFGLEKLNEQLLFHGTQSQHVDGICKEGFDWRMCGTNGTAFGQGCYFAVDAQLSLRYCGSRGTGLSFVMGLPLSTRARIWDQTIRTLYGSLAWTTGADLAKGILGSRMHGTGQLGAPVNMEEHARIAKIRSTLEELNSYTPALPVQQQKKKIRELAASLKLLEAGVSGAVAGNLTSSRSGFNLGLLSVQTGRGDGNPKSSHSVPFTTPVPVSFGQAPSSSTMLAAGLKSGNSPALHSHTMVPSQSISAPILPTSDPGFGPLPPQDPYLRSVMGLGLSSFGPVQGTGTFAGPGQSGSSAFGLRQPGGSTGPGSVSVAVRHLRFPAQHMQNYFPHTSMASQAFPTMVTSSDNGDEEKVMFVARVLCGRATRGSSGMRKPPADLSDPSNRPFNSTCDNERKPTLYVVYDSAQAYPEYMISFSLSDCELH